VAAPTSVDRVGTPFGPGSSAKRVPATTVAGRPALAAQADAAPRPAATRWKRAVRTAGPTAAITTRVNTRTDPSTRIPHSTLMPGSGSRSLATPTGEIGDARTGTTTVRTAPTAPARPM